MSGNQLSSIPTEIGNLNSLYYLDLSYNLLSGTIPEIIYTLTKLGYLDLSDNQLSGEISSEIGNLTTLSLLDLSNNEFSGSIPLSILYLFNLNDLNLSHNSLSGTIPLEIGYLISLNYLNLSHNQLNGTIPEEMKNINFLFELNLNNNELNGCFQPGLSKFCDFTSVVIDEGNNFDATWEDFCANNGGLCTACNIDEWTALKALYASTNIADLNLQGWDIFANNINPPANCDFNNLYGVVAGIPPIQGFPQEDDYILEIVLNNESISGSIPDEIGNLKFLQVFNLSNNQLEGSIPYSISNFEGLTVLDLSNNKLSGTIPFEVWNLCNLFELNLSHNEFYGSFPNEGIKTFDFLNKLSLNNNKLSGCFDESLSQFCDNMVNIDAGNNFDATWEDFCTNGTGTCIEFEMNIKLLLEGAYIVEENQHINDLWGRGLLPGMTPINTTKTPTPKGQPYNTAPWNYKGEEGLFFSDSKYSDTDVDWVLVSLRTSPTKSTEIFTAAGILDVNGDIRFVNTTYLSNITQPLYVVVEHHNHLPVMSHKPVSFSGNSLSYNFSTHDSYRIPSSYGQKLLSNGKWAALAGNADQIGDSNERDDINGGDKAPWEPLNGFSDLYSAADYNLDADVNGADKALWLRNNGKSCIVNQ